MRPWALLALLLLAAGRAGAQPEPPPESESLTLSADLLELEPGDRAQAQGDVRLESSGLRLRADSAQADLASGDLIAAGRITLTQDSRVLTGQALRYNLKSRAGRFEHAQARSGLAVVGGEEIGLEPDRYVVRGGSFTTCPRDPPHYRVTAQELIVYPGKRVVARRAAFWVRNRRLFTLPEHSFSLRREQAAASGLFPRVGFSRSDGAFAGPVYGFAPSPDLVGLAELRFTSHRGLRVLSHLTASRPWGTLTLAATVREDLAEGAIAPENEDTGFADVTVDRLPEASAHWNPVRLARGLTFGGDASVGHYRESPRGPGEARADLRGLVTLGPFPLGGRVGLEEAVSLRPVWYGDGQHRFIWGTTTALDYRASPRLRLGLSYFDRHPSGSTPFRFDEVEITRGMGALVAADISPRWATRLEGRYDLRQKTFRDADITLTYRGDCLDYSIGWRKARGMVTLGIAFPQNAFGP